MKPQISLGLVSVAALLGCGGGGGSFSTSVPSGTKLTALTPAQDTQLCNDFQSYTTGTLEPDTCRLAGFEASLALLGGTPAPTDADLQTACTQTYTSCLTGGDGGSGTTTETCDVSSAPATCTATVGDLQNCLNAEQAQLNTVISAIPSCSTISMSNILTAAGKFAGEEDAGTSEPAVCAQFDSTCGGDSTSSSSVGALISRMQRR